jgi:putative ABC transport system permease protein
MNRRSLFLRMLFKAAWVRKDRALTVLISAAVVATIATAALTVNSDLENKLSRDFRGFGANVIVSDPHNALTQYSLAKIPYVLSQHNASLASKLQIVPVAYAIATTADGSRVVIGGTNIPAFRELNSWWSVHDSGNGRTQVLLGSRAARILSPEGDAFTLSFGDRQTVLKPELVFDSGADDDSRVYIDLERFQTLTGVQANTALVRIEGRPREIQDAITRLSAAFPNLEITPVRQITQAQAAVVGRTRSLVLAASAVIVTLIMLCMIATLTNSVLDRRKDFAVMKALGAGNRTLSLLFASESVLLALAGAVAGFVVGSGLAYWIGKANFDAAILPQPVLLGPVLLGSMAMALLATTTPLRLLRQVQPAGILRGE